MDKDRQHLMQQVTLNNGVQMPVLGFGVFQITEPYSTDVSDYGYYNTDTRTKSISVTVTTKFRL